MSNTDQIKKDENEEDKLPKNNKYFSYRKQKSDVSYISYRFRAYPTKEQKTFFAKTFGCCRFLWNRYVDDESYYYQQMGKSLNNNPADYKEDYPFLKEVDCYALGNVHNDYLRAMQAFYKGNAKYPKFKKKGKCKNSYKTNKTHTNITLIDGQLKLPKLPGKTLKVIVHRQIPENLNLKSVTVTLESDGAYYVSILYEEPVTTTQSVSVNDDIKAIGLDMSLPDFFVSSDGFDCKDLMHFYRKSEEKLAKEQKKMSRMKYGSNNYNKQKLKVAKVHAKIKHQRKDMLQKISTWLVRNYDVICIEDLNMQAMAQSLNFGKSVNDNGWGMFVNMLEYKCKQTGKFLIKIDKWYPSSQTCSECGYENPITKDLSVREWTCPKCGKIHQRDLNAAVNIKNEGLRVLKEQFETEVPNVA